MNDDPMRADNQPGSPWTPIGAGDPIDRTDQVRTRQRSGARALALVLGAFVVLIFAITIVKIRNGG